MKNCISGLERERQLYVLLQYWGTGHVSSKPPDEKYWRERAEEAYAQADRMTHLEARRMMLEIAAGYQRLAQLTEERTGRRASKSS